MSEEILTTVKSNLAFAGTGWIGYNRMKSLLDEGLCNPVAVHDTDLKSARKAADLAPGTRVIRNFEELLEMRPDGIVIATPSAMHAAQCIKALQYGIPVFCQKPLARNAGETAEVITAAYVANRHLGVDMSYRHTDGMRKIFDVYRHQLGHIFSVDLVFNNAYGPDKQWFYNPKLSGGGCLPDLGIHLIDLALWILDFPGIAHISSSLFSKGRLIEPGREVAEDYVSAQLTTTSGTLIRIVCSWNLHAGDDAEIKASFHGTSASALFRNVKGSFFNFEALLAKGTRQEIISSPPDDWGGQALAAWTREIQESNLFRKSTFMYYRTAEVIDRIYKKNVVKKHTWE